MGRLNLEVMKKCKFTFVLVLLACYGCAYGMLQISKDHGEGQLQIPQEKIFIHYNSSLLFVGEYVYYGIYTLNAVTNQLSSFSKIAYVELVGEDRQIVFRHKIALDHGTGQGDFFIPVSVPSGNYKLVGYTQWMRNAGKNYFFQENINIINPYQGNQSNIQIENDSVKNLSSANTSEVTKPAISSPQIHGVDYEGQMLSVSGNSFKKRSKVTLKLKTPHGLNQLGNYSLSVRKTDPIKKPLKHSSMNFPGLYTGGDTKFFEETTNVEYLPEIRGELVFGRVVFKENDLPAKGINIAFSIVENGSIELKVVSTNNDGVFQLNINGSTSTTSAIIQVLHQQKEKFSITLDKMRRMDYSDLKFDSLVLHPNMRDWIVDRSVQNQIENGYYSVKPDTLAQAIPTATFNYDLFMRYNLDDYKRFSTLRETLVEIIENVWAKKIDKEEILHVGEYNYDFFIGPQFRPLVVVDGVLIQDQKDLLEYNSRKIQSIHVLRDKYVLGPQIFQGVVSIETIEGDYPPPLRDNHIIEEQLFRPFPRKKYFQQGYSTSTKEISERIPDFRRQLLWLPNLNLDHEETIIHFYTSDLAGDYEISLEGFSSSGAPASVSKIIRVD